MSDLLLQLQGKRLTTAQIYYYFPDYPKLIQEFLWQDYDIAPSFPKLRDFINFWTDDIEGKLHSVLVGGRPLISAPDLQLYQAEFKIDNQ